MALILRGANTRPQPEAAQDHVCFVDCDPTQGGHMMYPAEPNAVAGRYQASENLRMTRREYRASGQDESRNVRLWNLKRRTDLILRPYDFMTRSQAVNLPGGLPFVAHESRTTYRPL